MSEDPKEVAPVVPPEPPKGGPEAAEPVAAPEPEAKAAKKDKRAQAIEARKAAEAAIPPKVTLKAARRRQIEQAATIEQLNAVVATLKPDELAEAQVPIYQARRRIVAAGIPAS